MKKLKHTYREIDLHMGNAPGCDAEAFAVVVENSLVTRLFFYPSGNPDEKAFDIEDPRNLEKKEIKLLRQNERTIFERNRNIVDICDMIIAVPRETLEKKESETWMAFHPVSRRKSHEVAYAIAACPGSLTASITADRSPDPAPFLHRRQFSALHWSGLPEQ
jgi:hypothetical protein